MSFGLDPFSILWIMSYGRTSCCWKAKPGPCQGSLCALQILFIISLFLLFWVATFCLLYTMMFGPAQAAGECPCSSSGAGVPAPFLWHLRIRQHFWRKVILAKQCPKKATFQQGIKDVNESWVKSDLCSAAQPEGGHSYWAKYQQNGIKPSVTSPKFLGTGTCCST